MARTPSPVAPACDQPVPARPSADGTPAHKGGACSWIVASLTSWTPKLKQMGVHENGETSDPSSGMSLGDALRLPKRHPAYRRREAQPGSCMERENLDGDAKGKGASGSNREAESTDAPDRGGLPRSSDEAG